MFCYNILLGLELSSGKLQGTSTKEEDFPLMTAGTVGRLCVFGSYKAGTCQHQQLSFVSLKKMLKSRVKSLNLWKHSVERLRFHQ
jgi:hypothetical protein